MKKALSTSITTAGAVALIAPGIIFLTKWRITVL